MTAAFDDAGFGAFRNWCYAESLYRTECKRLESKANNLMDELEAKFGLNETLWDFVRSLTRLERMNERLLITRLDLRKQFPCTESDPQLDAVLNTAGPNYTRAWGKGRAIGDAFPTIEDLTQATREQLLRLRGVGPKSVDELEFALLVHGHNLALEPGA